MARATKQIEDAYFLSAALEGLELQKHRIEMKIDQVRTLLARNGGKPADVDLDVVLGKVRKTRDLSPAARKRISQAQKKRWSEYRRSKQASAASGD